jgi:hypothetical protein
MKERGIPLHTTFCVKPLGTRTTGFFRQLLLIWNFNCSVGQPFFIAMLWSTIPMRKSLTLFVVFIAAFLLFNVSESRADGLDTLVLSQTIGGPDFTLVWQLDSVLDMVFPGQGFYVSGSVSVPVDQTLQISGFDVLSFFNGNGAPPGGLASRSLPFALSDVPQLYTGPETSPTFLAGTDQGFNPINATSATLVVSTPGPSTYLLFLGFLVLAGDLIFRRVQV